MARNGEFQYELVCCAKECAQKRMLEVQLGQMEAEGQSLRQAATQAEATAAEAQARLVRAVDAML